MFNISDELKAKLLALVPEGAGAVDKIIADFSEGALVFFIETVDPTDVRQPNHRHTIILKDEELEFSFTHKPRRRREHEFAVMV